MFPNWTGWKTVKALLFVAGGFIPLVPTTYQTLANVTLAAIGTIVVTLSGSPIGPTVSK